MRGFRQFRWDRFCRRALAALHRDHEDAAHIVRPGLADVEVWCAEGRQLGVRSEGSLYRYAAAALNARAASLDLADLRQRVDDWPLLSQKDQTERLLKLAQQAVSDMLFNLPQKKAGA